MEESGMVTWTEEKCLETLNRLTALEVWCRDLLAKWTEAGAGGHGDTHLLAETITEIVRAQQHRELAERETQRQEDAQLAEDWARYQEKQLHDRLDSEARVRLIAVAPDLLAACQVAATYHPVAGYDAWLGTVNLLNAAIARATGQGETP